MNAKRTKKPTLAQILYEAYAKASEFLSDARSWHQLASFEQDVWQAVADEAEQWAYDNIQWQE